MSRVVALAALAVAAIAVAVLLTGGDGYTVTARFVDAGQLVKGGTVQVGGRSVGTIKSLELAPNGQADLKLAIDDDEVAPLRRGTIARVRTVGLTGVANRFVEITPGPTTGEEIADGGLLSTAETRGIVDLDVLFSAIDPTTRERLQRIIKNGAEVFKGRTGDANLAFSYFAPALFQSSQLADELVRDRVAVEELISSGATTAGALASRDDDIRQGITSTAATLSAIASEREALASSLERAPALLNRPGGVLGGLRQTIAELRPALREARPVAPRLAEVLRQFIPTSRQTRPVLQQTRALLPPLTKGLNGLPALDRVASPALRSTVRTLISLMPIVDGIRPYTPEIVNGVLSGLGSRAAGYYDANGHYARIQFNNPPNAIAGFLNAPGGVGGFVTGRSARCPGAGGDSADDGSNPYIEKLSSCDPDAGF